MYVAVFIGVLVGICVFSLLVCCTIFWCEYYRRSERRDGYRGRKGRWRSLGRMVLHRPRLTTQKAQQGIPISLQLESGGDFYEAYPLHPSSEQVDFFSDPLLLDSDSGH